MVEVLREPKHEHYERPQWKNNLVQSEATKHHTHTFVCEAGLLYNSEYLVCGCLQGEAGPMCPQSKNIYYSVCCHWHNNVNVIDQKSRRHRKKSRVSAYKAESEIETSAEVIKEGCEEILGVKEAESKRVKSEYKELVGVKGELNEELKEVKESSKDGSKIVNIPRRQGTKRRGRTVTQVLVVIVCS